MILDSFGMSWWIVLTKNEERIKKIYRKFRRNLYFYLFSRKAVDLNEIDVPAFKIGSGEASNLPLIRHISSFGKPIIMSTGMHSIDDLKPSIDVFIEKNIEFVLMECTNHIQSCRECFTF